MDACEISTYIPSGFHEILREISILKRGKATFKKRKYIVLGETQNYSKDKKQAKNWGIGL